MYIKRVILFGLVLLAVFFPLNALTINEILTAANNVSYAMRNAEITYQNNLLSLEENSLDDEAQWNVAVEMTPFKSSDFSSESLTISSLSASVTLPDDGNTTLSVSSPMTIGYDGAFYINPYLSAGHTFDFNYFDEDRIRDLNNAISSLSTERVFLEAQYSFNKSVISQLSTLLSLEKEIKNLEHTIKNAERDLDNMLSLRQVDETSVNYQRSLLELDMNRRSLDTYKDQYAKAEDQFRISTGLEWSGLDAFEIPSLNLSVMENGNSEVMEYSLESDVANLLVEEKERSMDPLSLTLSAGAGVTYRNEKSRTSYDDENNLLGRGMPYRNSASADVGAKLNLSNWSFGASFALSSTTDWDFTPSLTISGAWSNNTTSDSDRLELERLRNSAISARNDYLDSLTDYNIEGMQLQNRIMEYNFTLANLSQREEYLLAVLNSEKDYFEHGLAREDDVEDAQFEYDMMEYEKMVTYLEGLTLYYDILIYSL